MEMRAYESFYLADAKAHLGTAFDVLLNGCGLAPSRVETLLIHSTTIKLFSRGDPSVVAGCSGYELAGRILKEFYQGRELPPPREGTRGRTAEYWAGWALAHFQWYWRIDFRWIFERVALSSVIAKYHAYHEMDIMRFIEDFMAELKAVEIPTRLKRMREASGFSQSRLAELSGVNIRNIQLWEQKRQDISRAAAASLASIARVLHCTIEDLLG